MGPKSKKQKTANPLWDLASNEHFALVELFTTRKLLPSKHGFKEVISLRPEWATDYDNSSFRYGIKVAKETAKDIIKENKLKAKEAKVPNVKLDSVRRKFFVFCY